MPGKKLNSVILNVFIMTSFLFSASASAEPKSKKVISSEDMIQMQKAYEHFQKEESSVNFRKTAYRKARPAVQRASFRPQQRSFGGRLVVTATAYTSHANQTDSTPNIAAWGDRLRPGMKAIAVSRDLLKVYGLKHRQKVRIKGLKGEYVVLDKMNKRWRKKIDIYMGRNKHQAFRWGRRRVEIQWN